MELSGHQIVQYGTTVGIQSWADGLRALEESYFHASKTPKSNWTKARYPWTLALKTLEESHFCVPKISSGGWHEASCLEWRILRHGKNRFLKPTKMLNGSHLFFNQESHDPCRISFSVLQKTEQRLCGCEISIGRGSHETWVIVFSCRKNAIKVFTRSYVPLSKSGGFMTLIETRFVSSLVVPSLDVSSLLILSFVGSFLVSSSFASSRLVSSSLVSSPVSSRLLSYPVSSRHLSSRLSSSLDSSPHFSLSCLVSSSFV